MVDRQDDPFCELNTTVRVRLPESFWMAAATVAGLRKASNDPIRGVTRTRGQSKNLLNDLQGVVGELVVLSRLQGLGFECSNDLLDVSGPVDDVDIRAKVGDRVLAVEAKCLLLEPNKRLFLVNQIAHQRSVARGADGYVAVLTVVGADHAHVGKFMPCDETGRWKTYDFKYGDPALGLGLDEFCPEHLGITVAELRAGYGSSEVADVGPAIMQHVEKAAAAFPSVRSKVVSLPSATAAELVSFYASLVE